MAPSPNDESRMTNDERNPNDEIRQNCQIFFPLLAAFRLLIRYNDKGQAEWWSNPFKFFDESGARAHSGSNRTNRQPRRDSKPDWKEQGWVYEFARPSRASHRWIFKVEHEGCSRVLLLQPCALIFRAVPQLVDDAASALDGCGWQAHV